MMTDLSLTTSRTIAAPAARLFDAWLDPAMLSKFMMPMVDMEPPKTKTDPVEGGRFEIIMKAGDDELPHAGTYLEISRYTRLVFTWESPFSAEGSTVTIDFVETGNETKVTLTHIKFPSEESRDNHNKGWSAILAKLDAELA